MYKLLKNLIILAVILIPNLVFAGEVPADLVKEAPTSLPPIVDSILRLVENQENLQSALDMTVAFQQAKWIVPIGIFALGVILILMMGNLTKAYEKNIRQNFWSSLFAGSATLLLPIFAVILAMTQVGFLLALLLIFIWCIALIVTIPLSAYLLGSFIVPTKGEKRSYLKKLLALLIGMVVFILISAIPKFGVLILLTVFVVSLGSVALAENDLYKSLKKAKLL